MTEHSRPMREDAQVANIPVDRLRAHPRNIRADLGDLRELSASIRFEGVLVNLMVERRGTGRDSWFQILHGHRRWAAAQLAGVSRVPCTIVPDHADDAAMFLMLAEDKKLAVDPADRRRAVLTLRNEFRRSWIEIAERLGRSVGTVRAWAGDPAGDNEPLAAPAPPREFPQRETRTPAPRAPRPTFSPRRIHGLLIERDAGQISDAEVVEALRTQLGDWQPAAQPAEKAS